MVTDPHRTARDLRALKFAMAEAEPRPGVSAESVPGGLRCAFHPGRDTPYPSSNPNRVERDIAGTTPSDGEIAALVAAYRNRRIRRFFFWLDPAPDAEEIAGRLRSAGFTPFGGTRYPVLARPAEDVPPPPCRFEIRRLSPGDGQCACYGDEEAHHRFRETLGHPDFHHFAAFDGTEAVASARLFVHNRRAYLNDGGTREAFRRQGAQSSLIAARIRHAAALGCTECLVETLTFLETSLHNLQRAGFRQIFERQVWQFGP